MVCIVLHTVPKRHVVGECIMLMRRNVLPAQDKAKSNTPLSLWSSESRRPETVVDVCAALLEIFSADTVCHAFSETR